MLNTLFCLAVLLVPSRDTNPPAISGSPINAATIPVAAPTLPDTIRPKRRHAIEYSDAYAIRLELHKLGSYTMLPLFAAEYALGQNLLNDASPPSWMSPTHGAVALGIGGLFTVNTLTGGWNLWDSRQDPNARAQRWIHASLMLASDAGFMWAGAIGGQAATANDRRRHKNVAIGSMTLSTVGTAMMWLWKR